jgi:glucose/arabinose dehydrogenase/glyoxylase-like metal-dependent hydrolase (beta-lactamase superfamily II)
LKGATLLLLTLLSFRAAGMPLSVETWSDGLEQPWSIAFLPDGSALVTELPGRLRAIDPEGVAGEALQGVPGVYYAGQGGLFDVVLHPDFENNRLIYLSFAEGSPDDNGTAVARARFEGGELHDVQIIFRNFTRKDTPMHYGGRLAFLPDGSLLLTTGEGFNMREAAQDIRSGLGKVLRMNDDGSAAAGNPFAESPYVYSYGHRNPQGLAVSADGTIWLHEHGPRGGDEVNRIEAGGNYGWPAATHGVDYSGAVISPYTELEGMVSPVHQWTPSIAPSGLAVYAGGQFSEWRGDLLVGALVDREVRRLSLADGRVKEEKTLELGFNARIRDVRNGPGGALFVLTPDSVVRVSRGIETTHVSGRVHMLAGWGGNLAALAAEDGVVLVDDQYAPMTPQIRQAVASLSSQPVRYVINTHWHGDHTGGNEALGEVGAVVLAHEGVRRRMSTEQFLSTFDRRVPPAPPGALPVVTFNASTTLHLGGETVRVIHVPRAHTDGDSIVHFVDSDVIHMGDNFFNGMYPFVDLDSGGTVHGMIAAVQQALGLCGSSTRIIPGHGPLADCADLEDFGEVLYKTTNRVRRLAQEGKSLKEIVDAAPTADFDAALGGGWITPERFVGFVYQSLQID